MQVVGNFVRRGRSEHRGEAYFEMYVEPLREARPTLADLCTIPLRISCRQSSHCISPTGLRLRVRPFAREQASLASWASMVQRPDSVSRS